MELKKILEEIRVGEETVLDITGGEKDRKLTIAMRKLHPEEARAPKRCESKARKHAFLAAKSLAAYIGAYGGPDTVVFADPEKEEISAVLDERAKDGFEVVTMKPQVHPLWAPWLDLANRRHPLDTFAGFLAQHRRSIVGDSREIVMLFSQIRASVKIEVQRGRGAKAINGVVCTTEIAGQRKAEDVELPDTITVRAPLYVDTEPKEIELDLTVEAHGESISVLVSAGSIAEARVKAFEEMVEAVRGSVKQGTFTFGRPSHAAWDYLRELETAKPV
jgi:hypothetical protein